jgi:4-hydroxybenzoate polyprenyltransferase
VARPGRELSGQSVDRTRSPIAALARSFAFARPENWFASKIPPLLAIAYLEILRLAIAPHDAVRLLACALFSVCCVAIYGHVVNDLFDLDADRHAGKANRLARIRPVHRALVTGASLIAGFLPALVTHYSTAAITVLALNYLWPTIYSLPITRLKERGLLGVACDALGSHITPTVFVLTLASSVPATTSPRLSGFDLVATAWAGVLGFKGILHHQTADRDNDIRSGVVTFATRMPVEAVQRFLTRFNVLVELPVSALLTIVVASYCPLAIVAFIAYTGSETVKYELGFQFALSPDPATIRASVPFTNETFYVLWLPMAAAVQLAVDQPVLSWIPMLHAAVFSRPAAQQLTDWRAMLENAALASPGRVGRASRRARRGGA